MSATEALAISSSMIAVIAAFIAIWQAKSADKQAAHAEEQADAAILQAAEATRSADAAWTQVQLSYVERNSRRRSEVYSLALGFTRITTKWLYLSSKLGFHLGQIEESGLTTGEHVDTASDLRWELTMLRDAAFEATLALMPFADEAAPVLNCLHLFHDPMLSADEVRSEALRLDIERVIELQAQLYGVLVNWAFHDEET